MDRPYYLVCYHQKKVTGPQQDSNPRHVSSLCLMLIIISTLMLFMLSFSKNIVWREAQRGQTVIQEPASQMSFQKNTEQIF